VPEVRSPRSSRLRVLVSGSLSHIGSTRNCCEVFPLA
jgi:hypothetical protein